MATRGRDIRQAVVFVHGIGQQAPGETLRPFVTTLAGEGFVTKPDRVSEILEARRFASLPDRGRGMPRTDFYELYWAHRMRDGRFRQTVAWAGRLLFGTPFWRVESHLRAVFAVFQVLAIATLAVLALRVAPDIASGERTVVDVARSGIAAVTAALVAAQAVIGGVVSGTVSDAARYLSPRPGDVADQAEVRSEGIRLLRALHASGSYHRIVVVGHSLGSVIGYDVLRHVWDDLRHPDPHRRGPQDEMAAFDVGAAEDLQVVAGSDPGATAGARLEAFQQRQHRLWREGRERGVPWLVTDFVTLGSPLAHASLLLRGPAATFRRRRFEQELPTCPPMPDRYDRRSWYRRRYTGRADDGSDLLADLLVGNNGAPFGPTRWTNLYVPSLGPLPGDLVGGRVSGMLGRGIKDVAVRPSVTGLGAVTGRVFPGAHSTYWRTDRAADEDAELVAMARAMVDPAFWTPVGDDPPRRPRPSPEEASAAAEVAASARARRKRRDVRGTRDAATALRAAMRFDAGYSTREWPDPDPPERPDGVPVITA